MNEVGNLNYETSTQNNDIKPGVLCKTWNKSYETFYVKSINKLKEQKRKSDKRLNTRNEARADKI